MKCYFETSAINYVSQTANIYDAIGSSEHNKATGDEFLISPVVLWEIFLNKNFENMDSLIFFAQHFLSERLLPTTSEIIVDSIKIKMNLKSEKNETTSQEIGNMWAHTCNVKNATLQFNDESKEHIINKSNLIRKFSKKISIYMKDIPAEKDIIPSYDCDDFEMIEYFVNIIVKNNEELYSKCLISDNHRKTYKLATFFMLMFLVTNIDFDTETVEQFWDEMDIYDIQDKINFLIVNAVPIIDNGPLMYLAYMAYGQVEITGDKSRGLIFDCMHTLYLPYVDAFLTNDQHLINFSSLIGGDNGKKIN